MEKGEREQGAGDPSANDRHVARCAGAARKPGRLSGDLQRLLHPADQHVALAAKAFGLLHGKARLLQPTADKARRGEGGKRCARARQPRHRVKQMLAPHFRVFGGSKTVQEPRVDLLIHRIIEPVGQVVDVAEP